MNVIKKILPSYTLEILRFLRTLPDCYIQYCNECERVRRGLGETALLFREANLVFYPPESIRTYQLWKNHLTAFYLRPEVHMFCQLSKGCKSFVDIGSAEGFFSAIFASLATEKSTIYSLDAGVGCYFHQLAETRAINLQGKQNIEWEIDQVVLCDVDEDSSLVVPDFVNLFSEQSALEKLKSVKARKLITFCEERNIQPDLLKLDIESFEYEVITGSLNFLEKHKPKIHLELHNELLRHRGKSAKLLLDELFNIGYKIVNPYQSIDALLSKDIHLSLSTN